MKYTREQALDRIRKYLAAQRRGHETTCQTVARLGIFCHGYDRWSTPQLRALYPWLGKRVPAETPREDLLELVAAWDESRMIFHRALTTCDAKVMEQEGCLGFDRFTNQQIKRAFPQLFKPSDKIAD